MTSCILELTDVSEPEVIEMCTNECENFLNQADTIKDDSIDYRGIEQRMRHIMNCGSCAEIHDELLAVQTAIMIAENSFESGQEIKLSQV